MRHTYDKVPSSEEAAIQMEAIPNNEIVAAADVEAAASAQATQPEAATAVPPATVPVVQETVEVNASSSAPAAAAAPVAAELPPKYEDEALPTYGEVVGNNANTETVVVSLEEEVLVDGLPVGNGFTFLLSMLISWFFGLVGFFCVFLMSYSHAGRQGARAGFGLMATQFGIYLRSAVYYNYELPEDDSSNTLDNSSSSYGSDDDFYNDYGLKLWLAYLFMALGWFLFVRSCHSYFQAQRVRNLMVNGQL